MAMADYFVDPSITTDTGAGTVGDPWGHPTNVLQKALDTITRGSEGDRVHIKSGTTLSFAAQLSFATYGVPTGAQPIAFWGYDTAKWDGGRATIDLNGVAPFAATEDGIHLGYLDISGSPGASTHAINIDNHFSLLRCTIDCGDNHGGITCDADGFVIESAILDGGGPANHECIDLGSSKAFGNYCTYDGNEIAVQANIFASHNIIEVTSINTLVRAIQIEAAFSYVVNNLIVSCVAATGAGVFIQNTAEQGIVVNNYVEGFSGVGGRAFELETGNNEVWRLEANKWYNCTSGLVNLGGTVIIQDALGGFSATTSSGLVDACGSPPDYTPTSELTDSGVPQDYPDLTGNETSTSIGPIQGATEPYLSIVQYHQWMPYNRWWK